MGESVQAGEKEKGGGSECKHFVNDDWLGRGRDGGSLTVGEFNTGQIRSGCGQVLPCNKCNIGAYFWDNKKITFLPEGGNNHIECLYGYGPPIKYSWVWISERNYQPKLNETLLCVCSNPNLNLNKGCSHLSL